MALIRKDRITNQSVTQTVNSDHLLSGSYLFATVQADYSLSATEFMMLKNRWVSLYAWALNIAFATFGFGMSVLPKFISGPDAGSVNALSKGEWWTLAVGMGLVILFCLIGFFLPNERKEAMNSIKEHFKIMPKSRQQIRGSYEKVQ
ncbi:hypothetical protein [Pseudomonas simiae]|uniref:hypothetical protein n=1 Tax=Pseudomonas simiae TaxID=321846 RepID=UPI00209639EA|nr:hypothetical protein [Pseudomonas simiae]